LSAAFSNVQHTYFACQWAAVLLPGHEHLISGYNPVKIAFITMGTTISTSLSAKTFGDNYDMTKI